MKTFIKTFVYVLALVLFTAFFWLMADESSNPFFMRFVAVAPELAIGIVACFIFADMSKK